MADDLLGMAKCGLESTNLNITINNEIEFKKHLMQKVNLNVTHYTLGRKMRIVECSKCMAIPWKRFPVIHILGI